MLLIDDILFSPVTSVLWIFREIDRIAHEELNDEAPLITEQLRVLYMQLETGRITEPQFDAEEKVLLDRLDAIESRLDGEEKPEEPGIAAAGDDTGDA